MSEDGFGKLSFLWRIFYLIGAGVFILGSIPLFLFSPLIIPFILGVIGFAMGVGLLICAIQGITINEFRAREKARKMAKKDKLERRTQEILSGR